MAKGSGCPNRGRGRATVAQIGPRCQDRSHRDAYAADMLNAQRALANNDLGRARMLVDRYIPGQDELDVRGFEWRYLWGRTRGDDDLFSGRTSTTSSASRLRRMANTLRQPAGGERAMCESGTSKDRELVNRMPRPPTA